MIFDAKTFLVTGAASGLGAATAEMIVRRGACVVLADVNEAGHSLARRLGNRATFASTDVTSERDAQRAVDLALASYGRLDGLVNCAGVAPSERILGRSGAHALESFTRTISVNLIGTFNMLRLAAMAMMRNYPLADGERGVIINTASIAAYEGQIGQCAYAASKAGIVGLTLPAARELARSGIRVVTIAPGIFETPLVSGFSAEIKESLAHSVPFPGRLGTPGEFAQLVETICELPMLNGTTIRLDGALRMAPK